MARSFRGKEVNMIDLATRYGANIAIGNVRMNGRGDLIGRNGKIVKTREEQIAEYLATHQVQEGSASFKKEKEANVQTEQHKDADVDVKEVKPSNKKVVKEKTTEKTEAPTDIVYDEE